MTMSARAAARPRSLAARCGRSATRDTMSPIKQVTLTRNPYLPEATKRLFEKLLSLFPQNLGFLRGTTEKRDSSPKDGR